MMPPRKSTAIALVIGLCAGIQLSVAQPTNRSSTEITPIAFPNLDSDNDGLPDNVDPDPIIANYTAIRWEVTSVSLDYDVKQKVVISQGQSSESLSQKSTRGTFSWLVAADGRMEGEVRTKAKLSGDPLKLFGLRDSGVEASGAIAASASTRVHKERTSDDTELSSMKSFLSISDETAVGDLHLGFSVNILSLSHSPLVMQAAPIPVLIAGRHVANANPSDVGLANVIIIPADRPEGVLLSFRAEINNTKAFELVRCLRRGDSPIIDLAHSRISITSKNDSSEVDLISKIRRIEAEDCLLSVHTAGGSVSWRIAPRFGLKPVTLRQAMKAINDLLRRDAHAERDFFDFSPTGLKSTTAGYTDEGVWMLIKGQTAAVVDTKALDDRLDKQLQISLLEKQSISDSVQEVVNASSRNNQKSTLLGMRIDFPLWKAASDLGWPDALYLLAKCYEYGVEVAADERKAFGFYRKAADQNEAFAQCALGNCYLQGNGVAKDEVEALKWYRKAAEQNNAQAQFNLGYCYEKASGVAKDEVEAVKWYRKAAEQDYAEAQFVSGHSN